MKTPPRIGVIVARVGPYHAARMRALAETVGVDRCVLIEIASRTREYGWDAVETDGYRRVTVFPGSEYSELSSAALRRGIGRTLEESKLDVVAVNGWGFPEARAAARWCRNNARAAVLMSDSQERDAPRLWPKEFVKRRLMNNYGSALVGGTPHVDYVAALGMPRDRIVLGYDVVDNDHFARGADRARSMAEEERVRLGVPDRYFLTCARFIKKKGLDVLLHGYAAYVRASAGNPWSLVLVGDGPLRSALVSAARKQGIAARVHFPGFVQYEALPAYYGLAHAFVLPSLVDQWGLVVNEAMASGLPVVVSEASGSSFDLVREGENGYRVHPGDPADLAAKLRLMARSETDRQTMGRHSRELIASWSPARFAGALLEASEIAIRAVGTSRDIAPGRVERKQTRVVLVTNIIPPYRVPVFRHISTRLGGDFRVLAMSRTEKNRFWAQESDVGCAVDVAPGLHWFFARRDWAFHVNWGVHATLRRNSPRAVVIGGWDTATSWGALMSARRLGARTVLWSGSHALSARLRRGPVDALKRMFVRHCDSYFAYGSLAADYLVSLGAARERIVVGSNAIDTELFGNTNDRETIRAQRGAHNEVIVLFSGQLIERKGLGMLIRCLAEASRDAVLWVAGDGPLRREYEALAARLLPGRARFLGPTGYREMADVYAAADVVVMPSFVEVWGLVVNEAMAAGRAVIASATAGATADLVIDGETGLRFDPNEANTLTLALRRAIESPAERTRMGANARRFIAERGTERYADDMLEAVRLALDAGTP